MHFRQLGALPICSDVSIRNADLFFKLISMSADRSSMKTIFAVITLFSIAFLSSPNVEARKHNSKHSSSKPKKKKKKKSSASHHRTKRRQASIDMNFEKEKPLDSKSAE